MDSDSFLWPYGVAAATAAGLGKGGFPAAAMLAVPILSLVLPPMTGAALLLPVLVLSDAVGLAVFHKGVDRFVLAAMLPGAAIGILLGWVTASATPDWIVIIVNGLIGLVFALTALLPREVPRSADARGAGTFWGAVTGYTSFAIHAGVPPYQAFVQGRGLTKESYAATATAFFAILNIAKLGPYAALGQLSGFDLRAAGWLIVIAVVAVLAGKVLVRIIPPRAFFFATTTLLAFLSCLLLWDGFVLAFRPS